MRFDNNNNVHTNFTKHIYIYIPLCLSSIGEWRFLEKLLIISNWWAVSTNKGEEDT